MGEKVFRGQIISTANKQNLSFIIFCGSSVFFYFKIFETFFMLFSETRVRAKRNRRRRLGSSSETKNKTTKTPTLRPTQTPSLSAGE